MDEIQKSKPRRPHFKTRTGCVQCKKRKVKCDEQKPTCTRCKKSAVACSYIRKHTIHAAKTKPCPTSSPQDSPTNTSSLASVLDAGRPAAFTTLDLELIYSWTSTSGPQTFLETPSALSTLHLVLVDIALQEPFLMHEILSLSALFLGQTRPHSARSYNLASATHHDRALSLFQPALASLSRSNCDACFAFSLLLTIHTFASQAAALTRHSFLESQTIHDPEPAYVQWIKIHRGNNAIHTAIYPWLEDGFFAGFRPWKALLEISTPQPLTPLEQEHLDSVAKTWTISTHGESVKLILNRAMEELRNTFSLTSTGETSMKHIAALAWLSLIPGEFVRLIEASVPEAILILASYAVVLKRMDYMWWCKGTAEGLLTATINELGGKERWVEYLKWPIEMVLQGGAGTKRLKKLSILCGRSL